MPALSSGVLIVRAAITAILLLFALTFAYLYFVQDMRFYVVPTRSMEPTLHPMDRIVAVKARAYERGDIVVFPDPDHPGDFLAKRIVAIGGDTVAVADKVLVVNDRPIREPYLAEAMDYGMAPRPVPRGEVFVLGDNRNQSEDSFTWERGIPNSQIRGRVVYVYMPLDRFQRLPSSNGVFAAASNLRPGVL